MAARPPRFHASAAVRAGLLVALACAIPLPTAHAMVGGANDILPIPSPAPVATFVPDLDAATKATRDLETSTGGPWQVRWNARFGVAAWGSGGPPPGNVAASAPAVQARADAFRTQNAAVLGAAAATLVPVRLAHTGKAWHVTWLQEHAGKRVLGSFLDLTLAEDGTVVAFHSTLVPNLQPEPATLDANAVVQSLARELGRAVVLENAESVIAVLGPERRPTAVEALEVHAGLPTGARWRAVVGPGMQLLELESLVRHETLRGTARSLVQPRYIQDEPVDVALPWLELRLGFGEDGPRSHTDAEGSFRFEVVPGDVLLRCGLSGLYATVDNQEPYFPSPHYERVVTVPGDAEVRLSAAAARPDETTIYYHTNRMHDFLQSRFGFTRLDFAVPALAAAVDPVTGDPNYPNAYWNGTQMGFGQGGRTYWNLGLFAEVIYHEYTHAATDYIYRPVGGLRGPLGAAMHEALSDYFAATLTDDPDIGEFLQRRTPDPLRSLANRLIWPEHRDARDEPHANGIIFGGALWDVRRQAGAAITDALVHFARESYPLSFEEYLEAMLVQDDLLNGDGWSGNGSPHRDALLTGFAAHGMGPLGTRQLALAHTPLADTEDSGAARRVRVQLRSFERDDGGYVRLSYRNGGSFTHVLLERDAAGDFVGEIPAMPAGTQVEYYLAALRLDPLLYSYLPRTAPDSVFTYRVGADTEPPRLQHAPLSEVPAFGWPPELGVEIRDNVGVRYAYVEIWRDGQAVGMVGLAPEPDAPGVFTTRFPHVGGFVGERYTYAITAVDAARAGNTTRVPASGTFECVVVQDLVDDFERGAGPWRHRPVVLARPDPWHLSADFNHSPGGRQAWLCGATTGEYPPMTAAELVSDWFRIDPGARASIWSWMDVAVAPDGTAQAGGRVEIQRAGEGSWSPLVPEEGYTHTLSPDAEGNWIMPGTPCLGGQDAEWRLLRFDLTPWRGRARLRFVFSSGAAASGSAHRGWLLDDFTMAAGTADPTAALDVVPARVQVHVSPNPFNPQLTFTVQVPPRTGRLRLEILDARGRVRQRLLDAPLPPGQHRVTWDGRERAGLAAASGVYYYRLVWNQGLETGKVVLVR